MGEYNLLTRGLEWEVLDVCKRERIAFIAYSPTKYGFLSNETIESGITGPVPGSRIESATSANLTAMAESYRSLRRNQVNMNCLNQLHFLSRKYNASISQIAIQWLLQTGVVTSICVGVKDVAELEQNMSCLLGEFILTQDDVGFLLLFFYKKLQS
jgi:aryl-alcohol dehydrogenase (NADP+)